MPGNFSSTLATISYVSPLNETYSGRSENCGRSASESAEKGRMRQFAEKAVTRLFRSTRMSNSGPFLLLEYPTEEGVRAEEHLADVVNSEYEYSAERVAEDRSRETEQCWSQSPDTLLTTADL
jgi:hypothetical protein